MSRLQTDSVAREAEAGAERLDAEAFGAAFTAHARALWCIAAGVLASRDQVEDVLQEGALIALNKLDQFQPGTSFLAWMGRIVRFVALNHGRRRRRATSTAVDPEVLESVAATPRAAPPAPTDARGALCPEADAFDDEVLEALRGLGDAARACLLLRTVLDMSYRDIALALDLPEGTAMSHVHRARRSMRETLRGAERDAP